MALIVEDGTLVAGANGYIPVSFADAYFADRLNATWAALTAEQKDAAIINATAYIDLRWGRSLTGMPFAVGQALAFPRVYTYGGTATMPAALLTACAEYAVRSSQAPLAPDIAYDDSGRLYSRKLEEIGPIKEEFVYSGSGANPSMFRSYPAADQLLAGLLRSTGGRLVRA